MTKVLPDRQLTEEEMKAFNLSRRQFEKHNATHPNIHYHRFVTETDIPSLEPHSCVDCGRFFFEIEAIDKGSDTMNERDIWDLLNEDDQNLLLLLRLKENMKLEYVMRNAIEKYLSDMRLSEWFEAWVKDSLSLYEKSGLNDSWLERTVAVEGVNQ